MDSMRPPGAHMSEDVAWWQVDDPAVAASARAGAARLAARFGFDETRAGQLAILASEVASNLSKHARDGRLLLRALRHGRRAGVELLAIDRGPGMADFPAAMADGTSTAGTLGIGLGAIARIASHYDVYSLPGRGTALSAVLWSDQDGHDPSVRTLAGVTRAYPGEQRSGDAWAWRATASGPLVLVADGLGHGPLAAVAADACVRAFLDAPGDEPAELLRLAHASIGHTRGAAVAVAAVRAGQRKVEFAGVGNIAAAVVNRAGARRGLVCLPGIVGYGSPRFRQFSEPLEDGWLLVLHSDGLSDRWDLGAYPGLRDHDALIVAATLLRDAGRATDDASVVVAKGMP